jgi:hypothetical protein
MVVGDALKLGKISQFYDVGRAVTRYLLSLYSESLILWADDLWCFHRFHTSSDRNLPDLSSIPSPQKGVAKNK